MSANSQFDDCLLSSSFVDSPQVSLRLGRTLDADNIRTGHDVYFECDVKANPSPLRLEWLHNVNTWWRCTISKEAWLVEHRTTTYTKNSLSDSVMLFPPVFRPLFLLHFQHWCNPIQDTFGRKKQFSKFLGKYMCKNEEISSCALLFASLARKKFPNLHLCIGTSTLSP